LQTLIANGSAAGNLLYQATSVCAAAIVGANTDLVIARVLVNSSTAPVTIYEVGLASMDQGYYFLWTHDAVNQAIAAGQVAIVSYDFRTTV
jgi:hypothetical protein